MKNIPDKIYLQLGLGSSEIESDDFDFNKIYGDYEITWCQDQIDSSDLEYVRPVTGEQLRDAADKAGWILSIDASETMAAELNKLRRE